MPPAPCASEAQLGKHFLPQERCRVTSKLHGFQQSLLTDGVRQRGDFPKVTTQFAG